MLVRPHKITNSISFTKNNTWQTVDLTDYLINASQAKAVTMGMSVGLIDSTAVGVLNTATTNNAVVLAPKGFTFNSAVIKLDGDNKILCFAGNSVATFFILAEWYGEDDGVVLFNPTTLANYSASAWRTNTVSAGADAGNVEAVILNVGYKTLTDFPAGSYGLRIGGGTKGTRSHQDTSIHTRIIKVDSSDQWQVYNGVVSAGVYMFTPRDFGNIKGVEVVGYIKKGYGYNAYGPDTEITGLTTDPYVQAADLTAFTDRRASVAMIRHYRDYNAPGGLKVDGFLSFDSPLFGQHFSLHRKSHFYTIEMNLAQECWYYKPDTDVHYYVEGYYTHQGGKPKLRDFTNFNQWRFT